LEKEKYAQDQQWADDLAAVISSAGMKRPVLVGWSYGGRVISDFVRVHGLVRVAGVNFVAALTKSADSSFYGPGIKHREGMQSDDLATNIAATRAFLRACFEKQPSSDDFETMLAYYGYPSAGARSRRRPQAQSGRPFAEDDATRARHSRHA